MRLGLGRTSGRLYFFPHVHPKTKRKVKLLLALVILLCSIGIFYAYFEASIRPNLLYLCESQTQLLGVNVINSCINDIMSEQSSEAGALSVLEKNEDGEITAVRNNTTQMNLINSKLSLMIYDRLSHLEDDTAVIPFGNLISSTSLFANLGPGLPIQIKPMGYADINFSDSFTAAGINQVQHKVWIDVKLTIVSYFPGVTAKVPVTVSVPLEQTVLLGKVPDSYTHFQGSEVETEDRILDIVN
jgi:sporulation protein YunB